MNTITITLMTFAVLLTNVQAGYYQACTICSEYIIDDYTFTETLHDISDNEWGPGHVLYKVPVNYEYEYHCCPGSGNYASYITWNNQNNPIVYGLKCNDVPDCSATHPPTTKSPTNNPTTKSPTNTLITKSPTNILITKSPTNNPTTKSPTNNPTFEKQQLQEEQLTGTLTYVGGGIGGFIALALIVYFIRSPGQKKFFTPNQQLTPFSSNQQTFKHKPIVYQQNKDTEDVI